MSKFDILIEREKVLLEKIYALENLLSPESYHEDDPAVVKANAKLEELDEQFLAIEDNPGHTIASLTEQVYLTTRLRELTRMRDYHKSVGYPENPDLAAEIDRINTRLK